MDTTTDLLLRARKAIERARALSNVYDRGIFLQEAREIAEGASAPAAPPTDPSEDPSTSAAYLETARASTSLPSYYRGFKPDPSPSHKLRAFPPSPPPSPPLQPHSQPQIHSVPPRAIDIFLEPAQASAAAGEHGSEEEGRGGASPGERKPRLSGGGGALLDSPPDDGLSDTAAQASVSTMIVSEATSQISARLMALQQQQQRTYRTLVSLRLEQLSLRSQQLSALQTLIRSELYSAVGPPIGEFADNFTRLETLLGVVLGDLRFAVSALQSLGDGAAISSTILRELAERDDIAEQVSKLARTSLAVFRMMREGEADAAGQRGGRGPGLTDDELDALPLVEVVFLEEPEAAAAAAAAAGDVSGPEETAAASASLAQLGSSLASLRLSDMADTAPVEPSSAAADLELDLVVEVPGLAKIPAGAARVAAGASPSDSAPQRSFCTVERGDSCALCLNEYAVGAVLRMLPCGHRLHRGCIDEWLRIKASCPLCRVQL